MAQKPTLDKGNAKDIDSFVDQFDTVRPGVSPVSSAGSGRQTSVAPKSAAPHGGAARAAGARPGAKPPSSPAIRPQSGQSRPSAPLSPKKQPAGNRGPRGNAVPQRPEPGSFRHADEMIIAESKRGPARSERPTGRSTGSPPRRPAGAAPNNAGARPAGQRSDNPAGRPAGQRANNPAGRPAGQRANNPGGRPPVQTANGTAGRPIGQTSGNSASRPAGAANANGARKPAGTTASNGRRDTYGSAASRGVATPGTRGAATGQRQGAAQRPYPGDGRSQRAGSPQRSGAPQRSGSPQRPYPGGPQKPGSRKPSAGYRGIAPGRSQNGARNGQSTKNKKPKKKKNIFFRIFNFIILAVLVCGLVGAGAVVLYVYNVVKDIPQYKPEDIQSQLIQSSTLYDSSGNEIKEVFSGDEMRILVDYNQLPQNLQDAFVAIEDKTFWDHHGFNFTRIAGAVYESLKGGGEISGTSTITQQLARNIWLPAEKSERNINRKIKEAYYSIMIERSLTKQQILADYLNTISFGNRSYGVEAAAENYFGKKVEDLDLLECAALASLPKSPTKYSMVITVAKGEVTKDDPRLLVSGNEYDYLYNDALEKDKRINRVLNLMQEQGKITQAEHDAALKENLRDHIKPKEAVSNKNANFFAEYAIQNVAKDLQEKYDITYDEALHKVYTGGFNIYTTVNMRMQNIVLEEYKDSSNFPDIVNMRRDNDGNLLNEYRDIMLYRYSNYFNDNGVFTFKRDEYQKNSDGSLTIKKGYRLNLYSTEVQGAKDVSIEFKDMYTYDSNNKLNIIKGGVINIPQKYKSLDSNGNCTISAAFFTDDPDFINMGGDNPSVPGSSYTLRQSTIQPQSAMTIIDHTNGQIKAMVGGRNISGQMNYNRAINPRQPGSSIKPIGVYGAAIQMGADKEPVGSSYKDVTFGKYWTALSIIVDEPIKIGGKIWPKNASGGYSGPNTFRRSVEQSINVAAVKVWRNIGYENSIDFAKRLGITSIVESEKGANDKNPAAMALGGMTKGVSPLEMAAAYGTFANNGVYIKPICYTKVETKTGEIVLDGKPDKVQAMDPGAAFIVNDILRGVVLRGTGTRAAISGIPVAGKTGTTSDNCDIWFVGNTPKYSAAVWVGNDVKLELNNSSRAASALWGEIMRQTMNGVKQGEYPKQPSNVIRASVSGHSDYFIKGTVPSSLSFGKPKETYTICLDSGMLATPWCTHTETKTTDPLDSDGDKPPTDYCWLHNDDPQKYPVPKGKTPIPTEKDPVVVTKPAIVKPPVETKPPAKPPTQPNPPEVPQQPVTTPPSITPVITGAAISGMGMPGVPFTTAFPSTGAIDMTTWQRGSFYEFPILFNVGLSNIEARQRI